MTITASTILDMPYGSLHTRYHETEHGDCLSLTAGDPGGLSPLLVRLHSACLFGEAIGSTACECGPQLAAAMRVICEAGRGVIIYLFQEGRGVGLRDKIRALDIQRRQGLDTVAAMHTLGHDPDPRSYEVAIVALADLRAPAMIRLMSNNPRKQAALTQGGYEIVERVALSYTLSPEAVVDLQNRVALLGHSVDFGRLTVQMTGDTCQTGGFGLDGQVVQTHATVVDKPPMSERT